ncbi:jg23987 [Pararge aegeria aegeria]|uniref:Jg23987 protein n=1 Tax=Pararge aegeria aegeria TaxID=348720 RepID=A0A8S4QH41_9NEOP|nr:jg23987 [Pararge aegeria aegeria]
MDLGCHFYVNYIKRALLHPAARENCGGGAREWNSHGRLAAPRDAVARQSVYLRPLASEDESLFHAYATYYAAAIFADRVGFCRTASSADRKAVPSFSYACLPSVIGVSNPVIAIIKCQKSFTGRRTNFETLHTQSLGL